jgi:hypothetical protein
VANRASGSDAPKERWLKGVLGVGALFWIAIALGLISLAGPLLLWSVSLLLMVMVLALAGREINCHWCGVLIDTSNKFSLSRLQITLWTVMVLSAYVTIATPRILAMVGGTPRLTQQQALDIRFPEELLLAMGISATSFAGATLIKNNKKSKHLDIEAKLTPETAAAHRKTAQQEVDAATKALEQAGQNEDSRNIVLKAAQAQVAMAPTQPNQQALDQAQIQYESAQAEQEQATKILEAKKVALETAEAALTVITEAQGLLHKNADPMEARWIDLFRGEEISNYKLMDMAKVQMLFFTVVVVATYAGAISSMFRDGETLRTAHYLSFPEFSQSLNALLAISHGTYLSVKNVNHN